MSGAPGSTPLVSVVIPAYNAERTVAEAVESALAQGYPRIEVVVINDGSTDGTAQVLAGFGDRIRVVSQANAGLPAARNRAHTQAHGDLIAWLDADDLMEPDRLALQVEFLLKHPSVVLVSSEFTAFFEDGRVVERFADTYYSRIPDAGGVDSIYGTPATIEPRSEWCSRRWTGVPGRLGNVRADIEWGNIVHPPTIMFRRDLVDQVGELDAQSGPAADWEFFIRASAVGEFGLLAVPLLRYRMHAGQMSGPANSRSSLLGQLYVYRKTHPTMRGLRAAGRRNWAAVHASLYADLARNEIERSRWTAASFFGLALVHRPPLKVVAVLAVLLLIPTALREVLIHAKRRIRPPAATHFSLVFGLLQDAPVALLTSL